MHLWIQPPRGHHDFLRSMLVSEYSAISSKHYVVSAVHIMCTFCCSVWQHTSCMQRHTCIPDPNTDMPYLCDECDPLIDIGDADRFVDTILTLAGFKTTSHHVYIC